MALELPIAVYGNGELYRELFNAIATAFNDKAYGHLIKLSLCLTGTWAIIRYSTERSFMPLFKWLITYYIAFYVIFIPKATVVILDQVNTGRTYIVANIPLGLAAVANVTSSIGAGLTALSEKNFSLPDDMKYGQTGLVMASRLVLASTQFQITDPNFQRSMQSFSHQCIFYDLLLNKYSWNDLLTTTNIWNFIGNYASPARAFAYYQPGATQIMTCKEGFSKLNKDWKNALQEAATRYGSRLFPDANDPKIQLLSYLPGSYQFLTRVADDAAALMQQNMLANVLQDSILQMGASTNSTAALEAYAFTKAQQQKRLTNTTIGDMAAYWLPIMKNVLEATLYGSFVFIFCLLLFPFGFSIFKHYVASLMWIQLWAPLYAILNLFMSFYAQKHCLGALNLGNGTSGLALSSQASLAQVNTDVAGIAGYLSLSIPLIATGLVKGMMSVFSTAAQYIAGVTQGAASGAASDAVAGNFSLGNTNFSNHSAYNTSANHFDTNARVFGGMYTSQMPSGSTISASPDGSIIMSNQSAISNLGTSINLAHAIRTMASQQADSSYSAGLNYANAYVDSTSAGLRDLYELGKHVGTQEMSGNASSITTTAGTAHAVNHLQQLTERFARDHNISTATATRYLGAAYAEAKAVGNFVFASGSVGTKVEADLSRSHENRGLYSAAQDYLRNTNYTESADTAVRGMQEHSYRASNEQGQRLIDNAGSSFDKAQQSRHEMMSNYQQSQSYREMASYAEENATSINSNASQSFMNWMQSKGISASKIDNMMVNHPEAGSAYAQEFTHEQAAHYLHTFKSGAISSASDVSATFNDNNQSIPNDSSLTAMNKTNRDTINNQATQEGLKQDNVVDKKTQQDTAALIKQGQTEVNSSKADTHQKTVEFEGEVRKTVKD